MCSIAAKTGSRDIVSHRRLRKSTFSEPQTKLMCGSDRMKLGGSVRTPRATQCPQSWRETWNCSLMANAFVVEMWPSASSGV